MSTDIDKNIVRKVNPFIPKLRIGVENDCSVHKRSKYGLLNEKKCTKNLERHRKAYDSQNTKAKKDWLKHCKELSYFIINFATELSWASERNQATEMKIRQTIQSISRSENRNKAWAGKQFSSISSTNGKINVQDIT